MKLVLTAITYTLKKAIIFLSLLSAASAYSCDQAQMIDYDYRVAEILGNGYSTFGRVWALDHQEACLQSKKYGACLIVEPIKDIAKITIKIKKKEGFISTYTKEIKYNSTEVIKYEAQNLDIYLKILVSNTIADIKMAGRSCESGFPNLPRLVDRKEIDNMFRD